jgi:hypothetical protein
MLGTLAQTTVRADDGVNGVTAVDSRVSSDYVRAKMPDGSLQPESYSFGDGGNWGGEISDATIDKLHFMDVARVIAVPLAGRKYVPANDPGKTRLLIMLYWGTTSVPGPSSGSMAYDELSAAQNNLAGVISSMAHQTSAKGDAAILSARLSAADAQMSAALTMIDMFNKERDDLDFKNSLMLGYDSDGLIGTDYGSHIKSGPLGMKTRDEIEEIEENRYFVVLMAYDFQLLWRQKKHKLLWVTRFSINERHNAFDKALPIMAKYAAKYFGQPTKGLLRTRVPEGRVDIGDMESLGEVDAPKK